MSSFGSSVDAPARMTTTPAQAARTLHLKEPQTPEQVRLKEAREIADAVLDDPATNTDILIFTVGIIKSVDEWLNKVRR
jgi:hypothetical protein